MPGVHLPTPYSSCAVGLWDPIWSSAVGPVTGQCAGSVLKAALRPVLHRYVFRKGRTHLELTVAQEVKILSPLPLILLSPVFFTVGMTGFVMCFFPSTWLLPAAGQSGCCKRSDLAINTPIWVTFACFSPPLPPSHHLRWTPYPTSSHLLFTSICLCPVSMQW